MDFIKAIILLAAYLGMGPVLGSMIAGKRHLERGIFCLMVFMTAWQPSKITLMVDSIEKYRGHTKGFEGSFIEVLAVALIFAARKTNERRPVPGFRLLPPGTWLDGRRHGAAAVLAGLHRDRAHRAARRRAGAFPSAARGICGA